MSAKLDSDPSNARHYRASDQGEASDPPAYVPERPPTYEEVNRNRNRGQERDKWVPWPAPQVAKSPVNFLAFDAGGGVRNLAQLVTLGEIMKSIGEREGKQEVPKPCEYFDFMAGSGAGGLLAIMLGRWHMSIEEAKEAYIRICHPAYRERSLGGVSEGLNGLIARRNLDEHLQESGENPAIRPKVMIFAFSSKNATPFYPEILRSYQQPTATGTRGYQKASIIQAACATMAEPTFFEPYPTAIENEFQLFYGAGEQHWNPVLGMLKEAKEVYNKESPVGCVVSLGVGVQTPGFLQSLMISPKKKTLDKICQRCEEQASMSKHDNLLRFSVPSGLEGFGVDDWSDAERIEASAREYMQGKAASRQLEKLLERIFEKRIQPYGNYFRDDIDSMWRRILPPRRD